MLSFSFDVEIECKERMIVIYLNCFLHILMGWNKHLTYRSGKNGAFVIYYIVIYKCAKSATPVCKTNSSLPVKNILGTFRSSMYPLSM